MSRRPFRVTEPAPKFNHTEPQPVKPGLGGANTTQTDVAPDHAPVIPWPAVPGAHKPFKV